MAKKEPPPPEPVGDCPVWFVTYSDVITLLMTFFILLLTFATNEPESFEKMQSAMGDGGGMGFLRKTDDTKDNNSLMIRHRPRTARIATRGSETPPIDSDLNNESLSKGLKSLDEEKERLETTRLIELSLPSLVDSDANVTSFGVAMSRKFADHLRKGPFLVNLQVVEVDDVERAIAFGRAMMEAASLPFGRVGITVADAPGQDPTKIAIEFSRQWNFER